MNEKIKKMVEDGFAIRRISKVLEIHESEVKKVVDENSLSLQKESFNEDKIPYIRELYKQGVSAKQLGFKYGIDKRRIQKWADAVGELRDKSTSHRFTEFDQHIFDTIDSPAKAYWLGFFYADAYNCLQTNTFSVTLKDDDFSHLEKLAKFVGHSSSAIKRYTFVQKNKEFAACVLKLYSKHLCEKMTELGCPQAKSFIITYPRWLSSDLHSHFIRGMFDGDGCLTHRQANNEWKWSLVSTQECCESVQEIMLKATGKIINFNCISKTENNTYELETSGNEKISKIMNWLFQDTDESIRLDRKYNKYLDLISQQNNRKISRPEYLLSEDKKQNILKQVAAGVSVAEISKTNKIHSITISRLSKRQNEFENIVEIDGQLLTAGFFKDISKENREFFVEPLFNHFRQQGWIYPSFTESELRSEYSKLCASTVDVTKTELNNNSSLATKICKHFCHSFYDSTERNHKTMMELWNDDDFLKKLIRNRLVINWSSSVNETFSISHSMMIQGMRSMRAVPATSMFKPYIAKYVVEKYSQPGDTVGDYSCGFGGRLLGAMSANRKYIGTDPLTVSELNKMVDFYGFKNVKLIQSGSESYCGEESSIDLYWSSPPYFDQEYYSSDQAQAYNHGEDYFYNTYWKKTLENVRHMLKPKKWFGLNVKNYPRMLEMAVSLFGPVQETIELRTIRSHLTKSKGKETEKFESIYMFLNNK